jgi:hypothetical protein
MPGNDAIDRRRPVVFKPVPQAVAMYDHVGDTFREMLVVWAEMGWVDLRPTQSHHPWLHAEGDVLLYDYPTLELVDESFRVGLFANHVPGSGDAAWRVGKCFPWTFWGRHPRALDKVARQEPLSHSERQIGSVFLGRIENRIQRGYREDPRWADVVDRFAMTEGTVASRGHAEYLETLRRSRFGLCLRGYGPKCNREIEYLALGVVPVVTAAVDLTYWEPLVEGVHYLRVSGPGTFRQTVAEVSAARWTEMSTAGRDWYWRRASPRGCLDTTLEIARHASLEVESWSKP